MPEQFENGRKFDSKKVVADFDAKEMYLHPANQSVLFQKRRKIICFHHFRVFTRHRFQSVPVRVSFSKSTVFEICRHKMCRFRVNGRPVHHILYRFQNLLAPSECSLKQTYAYHYHFPIFLRVKSNSNRPQTTDRELSNILEFESETEGENFR